MTANQRGIIHLLPLLLVIAVAGVLFFLVATGKLKLPTNIPGTKKEPTVVVKTEYVNPFKKEAQYVNPFDKYKSPFLNVKE